MNWFKRFFNRRSAYLPEPKQIFLSWHDFYCGRREMEAFEVHTSQSGLYIEKDREFIFLREKGELYPAPHDKGIEEFKAKWWPKSGWSTNELVKLKMISQEEIENRLRDIKLLKTNL